MTIPVYTAMTTAQAAEWIRKLAPRAAALMAAAGREVPISPIADVSMTFLLAAVAAAKGGGFKVREFVAVLDQLGILDMEVES